MQKVPTLSYCICIFYNNTFQLINIIQLIYFKTSILLTIRECVAGRLQIAILQLSFMPMLYIVAFWRQGVIAI